MLGRDILGKYWVDSMYGVQPRVELSAGVERMHGLRRRQLSSRYGRNRLHELRIRLVFRGGSERLFQMFSRPFPRSDGVYRLRGMRGRVIV